MNKKLINQIKFMNEFLRIMNIYTECCDNYFMYEENRRNHSDLYNYYENLRKNLINCVKKYEVVK